MSAEPIRVNVIRLTPEEAAAKLAEMYRYEHKGPAPVSAYESMLRERLLAEAEQLLAKSSGATGDSGG